MTTGTGSREDVLTNIESVAMILLVYKAERVGKWSDEEVKDYEMRVHHYFQKFVYSTWKRNFDMFDIVFASNL